MTNKPDPESPTPDPPAHVASSIDVLQLDGDSLTQRYVAWRKSALGTITEQLEIAAVFRMLGPLDGKHVLDAGCGDGIYSTEAARRGAHVTGIDMSEAMLAKAKKRSDAQGVAVDWQRGDVQKLSFPDGNFDIVVAITLLCLVSDPRIAIFEMARVLAPGGRLILGDLHRWSLVALKRRVRGWAGNAFWRDAHFWTANELMELMAHAGLQPGRTQGAAYFPPLSFAAQLLAPVDPLFARFGNLGAAFLIVEGVKPED